MNKRLYTIPHCEVIDLTMPPQILSGSALETGFSNEAANEAAFARIVDFVNESEDCLLTAP